MDKEVSSCIDKVSRSFCSLSRVLWCPKKIKPKIKMRMFKAVIIPTLPKGSEGWIPLSTHMKWLQSFVKRYLQVIMGVSRQERRRDTELRDLAGIKTVETMLSKRRLRWLGHVARMDNARMSKQLLVC